MHGWVHLKEKIKGNIFFRALPFAFLIAASTIIGLFGGYSLGQRFQSNLTCFALTAILAFLGFFIGFALAYNVLKLKYDQH